MNNDTVNMNQTPIEEFDVPKLFTRKTKRLIFYILVIALPVLQFALFYVYVNLESFMMAFKTTTLEYYPGTNAQYLKEAWTFEVGDFFSNFKRVFSLLADTNFLYVTNALRNYVVTFCTSGIFSIFFSYYVYKKFAFS